MLSLPYSLHSQLNTRIYHLNCVLPPLPRKTFASNKVNTYILDNSATKLRIWMSWICFMCSKSGHLLPFSLSRISYGQLWNNKLQQMRRDAFPPNGALNPCYSCDFRCGDNDLNREHTSGKDRFANTQPKAGHVVSPFFSSSCHSPPFF